MLCWLAWTLALDLGLLPEPPSWVAGCSTVASASNAPTLSSRTNADMQAAWHSPESSHGSTDSAAMCLSTYKPFNLAALASSSLRYSTSLKKSSLLR